MTDHRAGQLVAEVTGANTAPPAWGVQVLAEVIGAVTTVTPAQASQLLAEVIGANHAVLAANALQLLVEVIAGTGAVAPLTADVAAAASMVFLSWSDDRGHSFGNPVGISLGDAGEYLTSLQWQRLGMARDRVFQLEWSSPNATALIGAWIDTTPAQS